MKFDDLPIELIEELAPKINFPFHLLNHDLYNNLSEKTIILKSNEKRLDSYRLMYPPPKPDYQKVTNYN
jgi:hypothetical protein